jgi:hypothetical protein
MPWIIPEISGQLITRRSFPKATSVRRLGHMYRITRFNHDGISKSVYHTVDGVIHGASDLYAVAGEPALHENFMDGQLHGVSFGWLDGPPERGIRIYRSGRFHRGAEFTDILRARIGVEIFDSLIAGRVQRVLAGNESGSFPTWTSDETWASDEDPFLER